MNELQAAKETINFAPIVMNFIQLLATIGFFGWILKKLYDFGERIASMESVFEYIRDDHKTVAKVEARQETLKKDVDNCFDILRKTIT